jgi:hypothetical protein
MFAFHILQEGSLGVKLARLRDEAATKLQKLDNRHCHPKSWKPIHLVQHSADEDRRGETLQTTREMQRIQVLSKQPRGLAQSGG